MSTNVIDKLDRLIEIAKSIVEGTPDEGHTWSYVDRKQIFALKRVLAELGYPTSLRPGQHPVWMTPA